MLIDPSKRYTATLETTKGNSVIALDAEAAPQAVNNFVVLADLGYWDEFPWVAVEPRQFALTGSPAAQPASDVGYTLPAENSLPNLRGSVGYWYRDDRQESSGSQFYILMIDAPGMDGRFGVFGQVVEGLELVDQLSPGDYIHRATITQEE